MSSAPRHTVTLILALLTAAALVNSPYLPVVGRRMRPEHLAAPLALALLVVSQLRRRVPIVRLDAFAWLGLAWVLVNGISSWLYAPRPSESIVHVFRMGLLVSIFLTVSNLPTFDAEAWRKRAELWLGLGLIAVSYGVLIWLLARYAGIWLPGAEVEPTISGLSVSGTQLERNLFGILAATLLSVAFYLFLAQGERNPALVGSRRFLIAVCAVAGSALALSLTRSAWVAIVIAGPLAYLILERRRLAETDLALRRFIVGAPLLLAVLIGLFWVLPNPRAAVPTEAPQRLDDAAPTETSEVRNRVLTLGQLGSDFTVNTRIQDARWAVGDWLRSPLLGNGTGSFVQIHGVRVGTEAWVSNLVLHTMVDTGLVGLAIQVCLIMLVVMRTWRAARRTKEPRIAIGLRAMTVGLLVMVVAYQVTDGTWLAVFWVHIGLMVNGVYSVDAEIPHSRDFGMPQIRNALSFVAACAGVRERLAMAIWLGWFELRRRAQPRRDAVKTLSFRGLTLCLDWRSSEHVPVREVLIREEYWPEPAFRPSAGQSVVDVGANAGIYCVYAATQVGRRGRVIAIEPNPAVVARLERNVQANGVADICAVIPVAISSHAGVGSLVVGANTTIGHLAEGSRPGVTVPVRTLDEIVTGFSPGGIDLMKIDVEGAELAVLQGGADSVRRSRRIVVEVSDATAEGILAELRDAGFDRIFQVDVGRGPDGRLIFGERRSC